MRTTCPSPARACVQRSPKRRRSASRPTKGVRPRGPRPPRPGGRLEPGVRLSRRVDEGEPPAHRPLGVVLVRLRVAEVDEQAVAQVLGDVTAEAGDGLGGSALVLGRDLSPVLGVELPGHGSRADEVAEEDGELPPFALRRRPRERGPTVAAEPLAGLVQRPAGGADLAEPAAALRTVAPLRAVTMTARRTPNFRLRFHDSPAPGGARCARLSSTGGGAVNGGRRLVDDRTRYASHARKINVQLSMALDIPRADRNDLVEQPP